ncbi:P-loop containing nucleoside triphosphate hydrolase protein [Delitschia confertaspora ATCC 74209]|uniref:P-loop containing nucleoside triphosphate hydrolase protein n=1 Tax=Delitschia confertaspora ATCC 74209 TaxID=1513339 RepID=A0A9P4N3E5_9PLEO|nr:P-loop containing nucleoside triphosphate hydrolase protein [Delitschia confertaspora ATCC 74209]
MIKKKISTPSPAAAATTDTPEPTVPALETALKVKDGIEEPSSFKDNNPDIEDGEDGKGKPQPSLKNYFRVFSYGTAFDRFLIGTSMITSIGAGAAMPLMNVVFGNLVGDFAGYFMPGATVTKKQFQASVNKSALYLVYLFIAKFFLSYISMLTIRISGLRVSAAFRLAYLRALFKQPVSIIDTISPGKVSTRITTSSNIVQLAISQNFALLFQSMAFIFGLYIVAFIKSWLLTFVASASVPFILILYGSVVPVFMKFHKVTQDIQEEASALAFEIFSSIRIVVAFGAEAKLARQHQELLEKAAKNDRKVAPLMGLMMSPLMLVMYGTFGLTFWFGIRQYTRGHIGNINEIVVVLFSVMMAVMNISSLALPIIAIIKAAGAATELFITIDAEVPDTSGLKNPDVSAEADIRLENVCFSYPSRPDVQILKGLNIRFEAGKTTAIVGPSGSGKSTVVSLLQRWYNLDDADVLSAEKGAHTVREENEKKKDEGPSGSSKLEVSGESRTRNISTGAVKIGDTDLRKVDLKWWRAQIGLVQQEPFLFNDTIFNNVAYGLCGTQWEDATKEEKIRMVRDACKEAYADEFISKLPLGYETLVGESGIKLSGGQRQRISIARSIIKNPLILILDEATSAIDVRTEQIVQAALDQVSKNRTTIVIAHRLSTIKRADKIAVLREGKLVEEGSHEELLKDSNGVYYGLVHAQKLTMEAEEAVTETEPLEKTKTSSMERSNVAHDQRGASGSVDDETAYKQQGIVMSFGRLIAERRSHWFLYTTSVIAILCAGAVYPIQAYLFANIIEVFTFTGQKLVDRGNFWSGMFGIEAAAVGMAYFTLGVTCHLISIYEVITYFYRQESLVNILRKRISFFDAEGHSAGSLTSRVSTDAQQIQQLMGTEMSMAFIAGVNLVGSISIAFAYGWKLSLVGLFCAMPPILAAGYLRISLEMKFEEMNAAVFKDSSQFASEAVGAFRTVLALIMEDTIGDRYQTLLRGHVLKAFGSAKLGTLVFAGSDSVDLACMALAFWYGGTLLASHEYGLVDFFVIYMAVVQGAVAAGTWFSFAPNMAQATAAANRILSMRPSKNSETPKYDDLNDASGGVSIELQNVNFTYKSREVPVLSDLNIKILPGQFAALVGASGCGKSTTISLLERFYDPTSGTILFNNQPITNLDIAQYRQQISLVSQEPTLYEGTIRENISLSLPSSECSDPNLDARIQEACRDAQIHEFIASLPEGYETRLGPKGVSLSGGQKQRLSLARALLRRPRVLLLDEATSSLDSESERLVQDAVEKAAAGGRDGGRRTVVAVAHRLATIQNADIIFVLGSGKVLEKGDHQSLLRKKGVYYQMCQAQALDR